MGGEMARIQSDASGTIKLPVLLDQAAAGELFAVLRQALGSDQTSRLDASAVETMTLPVMQLILSALKTTDKIAVANPSDAFIAAFKDAGLELKQEQSIGRERTSDTSQDHPPPAETEQKQSPDPTSANGNAVSKRILTIDDSKTMRDMLLLTLTDAGFEVLQAVDGLDGLDVLKRERVDVIITDINMPKMNGYEVIAHLRANPEHKKTPILVLTTESDQENKIRARDAGANGWIVKPFDPERLADVIYQVSP
jgi:two-component system chemotaxis response regulator CheY